VSISAGFFEANDITVTLLLSDNDTCKTSRLSLSTKHRWGWYTLHIVAFRERRFAFSVAMYMALLYTSSPALHFAFVWFQDKAGRK
jgi:hypothetical protein